MTAAFAQYATLPQSCAVCRREAVEDRPRWGCDGPSTEGVLIEHECVACDGASQDRSDPNRCAACDGTGLNQVTRCPFAVRTPASLRVIDQIGMIENGILPAAGGWEDQAATFQDAVRIVSRTRGRIEASKPRKEQSGGG